MGAHMIGHIGGTARRHWWKAGLGSLSEIALKSPSCSPLSVQQLAWRLLEEPGGFCQV